MRSPSTEANHLGFTRPSSYLLLRCNYLLEVAETPMVIAMVYLYIQTIKGS